MRPQTLFTCKRRDVSRIGAPHQIPLGNALVADSARTVKRAEGDFAHVLARLTEVTKIPVFGGNGSNSKPSAMCGEQSLPLDIRQGSDTFSC
jgi:hypothetical protein